MEGRAALLARATLLASLLVASCTDATPTPSNAPVATETPVRGGQLTLGLSTDITTLQPILSNDTPSASVWSLIYENLLDNDPATGDLRPDLAERFMTSADGKRVTFVLRAGLVWSDGTPLGGDDYKYMVQAVARSKKTPAKSQFKDIVGWDEYVTGKTDDLVGVQILDGGRTIQIDLRRGSCSALSELDWPPLPRAQFLRYWDPTTTNTATNIDDAPLNRAPSVASGPFTLVEYRPLDHVSLVRNERYFKGAPLVDGVTIRIFADQNAMRFAFIAGELVTMNNLGPADAEDLRTRMGAGATDFVVSGAGAFTFLGMNERSANAPWLADKRMRKALWYGLDIDAMIHAIFLGYAHRVLTVTPAMSWAYDATGLERYDFDPKRARALLESAGATIGPDGYYRWTDGRTMSLRIEVGANAALRVTLVQAMSEQYKSIGIKADVAVEPFNALIARLDAHETSMDAYVITNGLLPDLTDAYDMWHSSQIATNSTNIWFTDPELDRAVDVGKFGPDCGVAARRSAYHKMDLILNDAAPAVFLYSNDAINFRSARLVAPPPLPYATRYSMEKWWLRP